MREIDRRVGFGWSKKMKKAFYKEFGAEILFVDNASRLIRSMFLYMVDGKIVYTIENANLYYICGLIRDSLKEGKNLLLEAIKKEIEQIEITKRYIMNI